MDTPQPHYLASPTVTATRAAHAAGFTIRAMRNVVDAESFPLMCEASRDGRAWRRFTAVDVVRLAVLRRLLDYGFTLAESAFLLSKSVDVALFGIAKCNIDLPVSYLRSHLQGYRLQISREGREGFALDVEQMTGPRMPCREAVTLLNIGWVVDTALARLAAETPEGHS